MAKGPGLTDAICPFFVREASKQVTCEGIIEGSLQAQVFPSTVKLRKFERRACFSWAYLDECPVARQLYVMKENYE